MMWMVALSKLTDTTMRYNENNNVTILFMLEVDKNYCYEIVSLVAVWSSDDDR